MDNETDLLNSLNTEPGSDLSKMFEISTQGDKEVPVFLFEWLNNGFNASAAYKKLHPNISDASARVLGSRKLAKVNKLAILTALGNDYTDIFKQLNEGLQAMKWNEFTGEKVPDFRVRLEYLKVVGKIAGVLDEK